MALPNILIFSILVFVLALLSITCTHARRGPQQLRPTRGFKDLELSAARNFGKRAINMPLFHKLLLELIAYESKMRSLRPPNIPFESAIGDDEDNLLIE